MSYPGSINSLTVKTDGLDQIIWAAHMNDIRTALLDLVAALGNAPQGNLASVEARLDGVVDDDGKPVNPGNLFIVAKTGAKYSTIQSAINASSPSAANRATILVMPGTYTETVTTKNYVDIIGTSIDGCQLVAPSGQRALIAGTGATISNFKIYSEQHADTVYVGNAIYHTFYNCWIEANQGEGHYALHNEGGYSTCYGCTLLGIDLTAVHVHGGLFTLEHGNINGGSGVGAQLINGYANIRWSRLNGSDSACVTVDAGSAAAIRHCTWNSAPTGAGDKDYGAFTGTNANTDPSY